MAETERCVQFDHYSSGPHPNCEAHEMLTEPWAPIVLSLDGGGIRGLSSLYILRHIMKTITKSLSEKEKEENPCPLPCHFFDLIVGTSTGGLIAVMLGRLHMNVDDCINQYHILGHRVFGKKRLFSAYNHHKLEEAIKDVVKTSHGHGCDGEDLLRQHDYKEDENRTCKIAVVTFKDELPENNVKNQPHFLRSYDHPKRTSSMPSVLNHETLENDSSCPKIWEACRATSAAPFYFRNMMLKGVAHIDGALIANNPSFYAWIEAQELWSRRRARKETGAANGDIALLLSIGTGKHRQESLFGSFWARLKWVKNQITDIEKDHLNVTIAAREKRRPYFRFNVERRQVQMDGIIGSQRIDSGLENIKLDECKKQKTKKKKQDQTSAVDNDDDAASVAIPRPMHELDPSRYRYITFEKIKQRTVQYCRDEHTSKKLDRCAILLLDYYRRRKKSDPERWLNFITSHTECHVYENKEYSTDPV